MKISEILDYHSESSTIDYKRDQYPIGKNLKKHELLKDISAMANFPSDEDKYIIIGVLEKDGRPFDFFDIVDLVDQSKYQQYINSNIEPIINFEYKSFIYKGKNLAYFRIFNNKDQPYLFKKEVKNADEKDRIEYREGDGFIRVGTSTKKMSRNDFEKIYEKRFRKPDRKNDLIITPTFGTPTTGELADYNFLKYFDISLENISNKSIELDIEMKVYKSSGYKLLCDTDVINEIRKKKPKQTNIFGHVIPEIDMPVIDFHVDYQDFSDYIIVSRIKHRNQTVDIRLPQKSIEPDVFYKKILVIREKEESIRADVIIRSDDFSDGILTQTIEF
jgi:hypothetical protein